MLEFTVLGMLLVGSFRVEWGILSKGQHWWKVVTGQLHKEEEEILTRYESREDSAPAEDMQLNGSSQVSKDSRLVGWEFKIVRAPRNLFRDPVVFQQLCEEEAQAGWILLEKLDDRRVRFKRPLAIRDLIRSESLSYDPYRCYYGSSSSRLTKLAAVAAVLAMILPAYFGYTFVSGMLANSHNSPPPPPPQSFPPK